MLRTDFGLNPDMRVIKKNYCCICGNKLKRKFIFLSYKVKGLSVVYRRDTILTTGYACKNCNYEILYSKQKKIKATQKKYGSYILPYGKKLIKKLKINEYFDKEAGFYLKK